jgi:hypothetical protein
VTWSATTIGPARVPVSDLSWVGTSTRLLVATYGRGVWEMDQAVNPERILVERRSVTGGRLNDGRIENLLLSDGRMLSVRRPRITDVAFGESLGSAMVLEFSGRSGFTTSQVPRVGSFLNFRVEGRVSAEGCTPTLEVRGFNFETGAYDVIAQAQPLSTTTTFSRVLGFPFPVRRYLSPTREVRARLVFSCLGIISTMSAHLDAASWVLFRFVTP